MGIKAIFSIIMITGFSVLSFAQMDMKTGSMKKDTVHTSQKKRVAKKIMTTKYSSLKKDTIKALNDPMMNKDTGKRNDTMKLSNDMKGMDMTNMDTMKHVQDDKKSMKMNMDTMHQGSFVDLINMDMMSDAFSLNLPMARQGSGTGWLPDASPVNGYMFHSAKWMYMLHGNLCLRYNNQDFSNKGSRGGDMKKCLAAVVFSGCIIPILLILLL